MMILIGLCGFASLPQIARDLFPSLNRCRRRIRQLFDAAYLEITLVSSTQPNLVSLTKRGRDLVAVRFPQLAPRLRSQVNINLATLDHQLLLVDCRLYAARWAEPRQTRLVQWHQGRTVSGPGLELSAFSLHPDAVAQFVRENRTIWLAVEADTGTEVLAVVERKLQRYRLAAMEKKLDAIWFVVRGGPERQQAVQRLVVARGLEGWGQVLSQELVVSRPAVSAGAALGP